MIECTQALRRQNSCLAHRCLLLINWSAHFCFVISDTLVWARLSEWKQQGLSQDGCRRTDADPSEQGMGKGAESAQRQQYRSGCFLRPANFHLGGGDHVSGDLL